MDILIFKNLQILISCRIAIYSVIIQKYTVLNTVKHILIQEHGKALQLGGGPQRLDLQGKNYSSYGEVIKSREAMAFPAPVSYAYALITVKESQNLA